MDNAPIHHSDRLQQMCSDAGVALLYLPPYSPDLNPIELFFGRLKTFIKRDWQRYEMCPEQGFGTFLESCVVTVGSRKDNARGHFRAAGLEV
jgi:hypothetical protein